MEILHAEGTWREVFALDEINGIMDMQGWVHSYFLMRVESKEVIKEEVS